MSSNATKLELVLASTSPFRREVLEKLGLPFTATAPDADETPVANEEPMQLVARLAEAKAKAVVVEHPAALIIGSDQVAVIDDQIVGKPADHAAAVAQLKRASGMTITFYTGLCLLNSETGHTQTEVVPFDVVFRDLTEQQIEAYLKREQPYNCAGSFKSEALGIVLFERLLGDDPNTLIGLPLIRLVRMLENEGVEML